MLGATRSYPPMSILSIQIEQMIDGRVTSRGWTTVLMTHLRVYTNTAFEIMYILLFPITFIRDIFVTGEYLARYTQKYI
jgi:hypothetical protein